MDKAKRYVISHFEQIIVLSVMLMVLFMHYFVLQKTAFLNVYYLPVLIAGFFLGRNTAMLLSLFCILLVTFFVIATPAFSALYGTKLDMVVDLTFWGSFLILTSCVVGTLFNENEKKILDLKNAYVGILEILSKYLESADRYTKGHSVRVANLATEIAIALEMPRIEIENVKAAALLHDIGKVEISTNLIQKAISLNEQEKLEIDSHTEKGAKILTTVGDVLKDAVPIVLAHHRRYTDMNNDEPSSGLNSINLGACVISVADAYDAITSDRAYRKGKPPWQAVEEIEKESGKQFHPDVVHAFKKVMHERVERLEDNIISIDV